MIIMSSYQHNYDNSYGRQESYTRDRYHKAGEYKKQSTERCKDQQSRDHTWPPHKQPAHTPTNKNVYSRPKNPRAEGSSSLIDAEVRQIAQKELEFRNYYLAWRKSIKRLLQQYKGNPNFYKYEEMWKHHEIKIRENWIEVQEDKRELLSGRRPAKPRERRESAERRQRGLEDWASYFETRGHKSFQNAMDSQQNLIENFVKVIGKESLSHPMQMSVFLGNEMNDGSLLTSEEDVLDELTKRVNVTAERSDETGVYIPDTQEMDPNKAVWMKLIKQDLTIQQLKKELEEKERRLKEEEEKKSLVPDLKVSDLAQLLRIAEERGRMADTDMRSLGNGRAVVERRQQVTYYDRGFGDEDFRFTFGGPFQILDQRDISEGRADVDTRYIPLREQGSLEIHSAEEYNVQYNRIAELKAKMEQQEKAEQDIRMREMRLAEKQAIFQRDAQERQNKEKEIRQKIEKHDAAQIWVDKEKQIKQADEILRHEKERKRIADKLLYCEKEYKHVEKDHMKYRKEQNRQESNEHRIQEQDVEELLMQEERNISYKRHRTKDNDDMYLKKEKLRKDQEGYEWMEPHSRYYPGETNISSQERSNSYDGPRKKYVEDGINEKYALARDQALLDEKLYSERRQTMNRRSELSHTSRDHRVSIGEVEKRSRQRAWETGMKSKGTDERGNDFGEAERKTRNSKDRVYSSDESDNKSKASKDAAINFGEAERKSRSRHQSYGQTDNKFRESRDQEYKSRNSVKYSYYDKCDTYAAEKKDALLAEERARKSGRPYRNQSKEGRYSEEHYREEQVASRNDPYVNERQEALRVEERASKTGQPYSNTRDKQKPLQAEEQWWRARHAYTPGDIDEEDRSRRDMDTTYLHRYDTLDQRSSHRNHYEPSNNKRQSGRITDDWIPDKRSKRSHSNSHRDHFF